MSLEQFIAESNHIEDIDWYKESEVEAARWFLDLKVISLDDLNNLQATFAPGQSLRDKVGMNVQVGSHIALLGGPRIATRLEMIITAVQRTHPIAFPFNMHMKFEALHPYMDGNGRTGRLLWAWHMQHLGENPFQRPFLHTWYYQSLQHPAK